MAQLERNGFMPEHAVLDTSVIIAGLRSRQGASFAIVDALWQQRWTLVISNTVLTEYEEVIKREARHLNLTNDAANRMLDAICTLAERHKPFSSWVPVLNDPDDEAFVQLAVEANVYRIVTINQRHFAPAAAIGVKLLAPRDFLAIIRS